MALFLTWESKIARGSQNYSRMSNPPVHEVKEEPNFEQTGADANNDVEVQHVNILGDVQAGKNSPEEDFYHAHDHLESSAVDEVYVRKVYIMNKIINEHIGMTWWQYGLLLVSGVGWFLDNAWLQLVAVVLDPIHKEFLSNDETYGGKNSAMMTLALYAGLVMGAAFWGFAADIVGRRFSFNATLLICGIFGVACGGAKSFVALGGLLAATGFGIGGSLPVDGMLFLEFLPGARQQLLTLLSVFWPLGQLATSLIGWGFIATWSCNDDVDCMALPKNSRGWIEANVGWRYTFFVTGSYTLLCFFLRFVVFQIPESPKFLISKGRDGDAVRAMHRFAKICGKPLPEGLLTVASLKAAAGQEIDENEVIEEENEQPKNLADRIMMPVHEMALNFRNSRPGEAFSHLRPLFSTFAMGYTTAILWTLWAVIGLAYPLFNAFIVLYLKGGGDESISKTYRNYVIISVCGIPGCLLATWLVDLPRSGRRGAMAIGTLLTGVFLFGFTGVDGTNEDGKLGFFCVTSFTQNIMYGVLFCYTPETFPAPLRGAADGVGSSLNRLFGLFAPIIKAYQKKGSNKSIPLYISAALFLLCGLLMFTLRVETASRTSL